MARDRPKYCPKEVSSVVTQIREVPLLQSQHGENSVVKFI